jgi:hypothetical protein
MEDLKILFLARGYRSTLRLPVKKCNMEPGAGGSLL